MAIYFASDVHLGLSYRGQKAEFTERRFVAWLRHIEADCEELYLVGDIFDFWFEWRRVVPRGFVRLMGQLALMSDRGIRITIFAGNHDMWHCDYLEQEIGARVLFSPLSVELQGRQLFIAHGDNIGKERPVFGRILGSVFRSRAAKWLFSKFIHPNTAMRFGLGWSSSSRHGREEVSHQFRGENEYLVRYARQCQVHYDYFIFGHLHTPTIYIINDASEVVILGEWIEKPTYARMENSVVELVEWVF